MPSPIRARSHNRLSYTISQKTLTFGKLAKFSPRLGTVGEGVGLHELGLRRLAAWSIDCSGSTSQRALGDLHIHAHRTPPGITPAGSLPAGPLISRECRAPSNIRRSPNPLPASAMTVRYGDQ